MDLRHNLFFSSSCSSIFKTTNMIDSHLRPLTACINQSGKIFLFLFTKQPNAESKIYVLAQSSLILQICHLLVPTLMPFASSTSLHSNSSCIYPSIIFVWIWNFSYNLESRKFSFQVKSSMQGRRDKDCRLYTIDMFLYYFISLYFWICY